MRSSAQRETDKHKTCQARKTESYRIMLRRSDGNIIQERMQNRLFWLGVHLSNENTHAGMWASRGKQRILRCVLVSWFLSSTQVKWRVGKERSLNLLETVWPQTSVCAFCVLLNSRQLARTAGVNSTGFDRRCVIHPSTDARIADTACVHDLTTVIQCYNKWDCTILWYPVFEMRITVCSPVKQLRAPSSVMFWVFFFKTTSTGALPPGVIADGWVMEHKGQIDMSLATLPRQI